VDKRTLGIILTVLTVLFCGCPGLFVCLMGGLTAAGLGNYTTDVLGTTGVGKLPTGSGYGMLCGGLILIAIPIIIGIVMLRKPKQVPPADVIPPAS
jgi:ABC-type antimicrobial peptide transport system permease subunit